jgi:uncharacterized membrane protein
MAKTKGESKKKGKAASEKEYDLNGKPAREIMSVRDLTPEKIRALITTSRYVQLVLLLTVIGGFLRFYHLDFNSLWLDEASTLSMSAPSFAEIWKIGLTGDFHPPLYHWVEHVMLTFGQSEFVLRFVSALLGTLTIPVFYWIGTEFRDKNVGIISAALLTVSYFAIFYSQEAYSYAMVLFAFSLVVLFYFRALRTDALSDWLLFGIFSALAFWTHYYVFVPLGVIYLHAVITLRERLRKGIREAKNIAIAFGAMTVLILPLLFIVLERYFTLTASPPTYGVLGPVLIQETFFRFSGGYSPLNWIYALLYFVLMLAGLGLLWTENRNRCLFSAMFLALPLVISVIISSRMTMNPRYLIYLVPIYFALIAMSYPLVQRLIPNRKLLYAVIAVIFVVNSPLLAEYYSSFTKEDWRGFSQVMHTATKSGDIIVVAPAYVSQPFSYYYKNASDGTIVLGAYTADELEAAYQRKGNNSVYYVVTGDISAANPKGDAITWLRDKARFEGQHTGIYLFSSR